MPVTIAIITLGCAKNTVDSEIIKAILINEGYCVQNQTCKADIIIINTCGFINDAKEQSLEIIFDIIKNKTKKQKIVVMGCLAQRYSKEILTEIPEINGIIGNSMLGSFSYLIKQINEGVKVISVKNSLNFEREVFLPREQEEPSLYAYLKIAEGCDNYCTYCVIPSIRGRYKSKKPSDVYAEAEMLVQKGYKEIILIAQDTSLYGYDLKKPEINLSFILKEIAKIDKLQKIRILYCYPNHITEELLETIKKEDKICNYLDIPLQHLSDNILRKMGRNITKKEIFDLFMKIKSIMPDIVLRSTFIVGFPGETKKDFQELINGLEELRLTWGGFFKYSQEETTPSAKMSNQISEKIKQKRISIVENIQKNITIEIMKNYHGEKIDVLIEEKDENNNEWYIGRSYIQSPEIDGEVYVKSKNEKILGQIVPVIITGSFDLNLIGEIVHEFS